jgi:multiple sugar transport system ATP-binding protein
LPGQLSGGERQRVALGRAIVRQPVAFLFDEPLSNLDARLRVEMRRELKELHRKLEATMIYVTHDQVEALTLGDRIALMDRGVLQQIGTPAEVYDAPRNAFVAGFLGMPAMNLLPGVWREADDGTEFEPAFESSGLRQSLPPEFVAEFVRRPPPGAMVTLGVRPEDVSFCAVDEACARNVSLEDGGTEDGNAQCGLKSAGDAMGFVSAMEALGDATLVSVVLETRAASAERTLQGAGSGPTLVGKLPPRLELKVGDRVRVQLNPLRLHLFDEAGVSLRF